MILSYSKYLDSSVLRYC